MTVEPDRSVRRLLAALGTAMIATGQPIDEIEDELRAIGGHFGYPDLQVGAGPTAPDVDRRSYRLPARSDQRPGITPRGAVAQPGAFAEA